ncbi:MAG: PAS domain S-box protein [Kiritimatiellia bacterium]
MKYSTNRTGKPSKYTLTYVNPAFRHIPGFSSAIEKKSLRELFGKNMTKLISTLNNVCMTGRPESVEMYFAEQNIHLQLSVSNPQPGYIGCIFHDISKSKHLELMLSEERNRIADVLEGTNAGNWHWNLQSDELIINERWAQIIGYSADELAPVTGEIWRKTTHPEDLEKAQKKLDDLFRGKTDYYDVEFRQKHKSGKWVWINSRGKVIEWTDNHEPLYVSGIHLDITSRKTAENAVRESKENLRVTLQSIGDAVIATNTAGRITWMNPVAEKLTEWSSDEAQGKHFESVFNVTNSQTRKKIENPVERVLKSGNPINLTGHTTLISRKGKEYRIADSGAPIRDTKDKIIGVVLVFRDVTNEYALQEQLRQAQKMEAIGQLAGGIAHDFNNMLQAILGYAEIAQGKLYHPDILRESMDQIIKAGTQAKIVTSQLLAFSRRQVLQMTVLDLNEVISDLNKIILRLIGEHIHLDIQTDSRIIAIKADRNQLGQILTNICVNARDAMPEGGTVTIKTSRVIFDKKYCEKNVWAKPGEYAVMSITDNGCGISEETAGQVFDPFFSTKEFGKGSGLGLSTVYGLVQQHNGIIRIKSELKKGTTVTVYLPHVERCGESARHSTPLEAEGIETILLAEDDEMVRELCTHMLKAGGYKVIKACDGEEALALFDKNKDNIDLALLDVVMPKMGGKMVYDQIRKTHPDMRFLFASGYSTGDLHTDFILDQGISLIQKPYEKADLLKKIREILDGA